MVRARTVAIVAADLAAVVHMELAAAVAAPQHPDSSSSPLRAAPRASALLMLVALLAITSRLRSNSSRVM